MSSFLTLNLNLLLFSFNPLWAELLLKSIYFHLFLLLSLCLASIVIIIIIVDKQQQQQQQQRQEWEWEEAECGLLQECVSCFWNSLLFALSFVLEEYRCVIVKNVGGYRFSFKEICEKDGDEWTNGVVCFLIVCCQLCIHSHVCEYSEDNRTENVFDICFVVSSSLVLILLSCVRLLNGATKTKKINDLHLLFFFLLPILVCVCVLPYEE